MPDAGVKGTENQGGGGGVEGGWGWGEDSERLSARRGCKGYRKPGRGGGVGVGVGGGLRKVERLTEWVGPDCQARCKYHP